MSVNETSQDFTFSKSLGYSGRQFWRKLIKEYLNKECKKIKIETKAGYNAKAPFILVEKEDVEAVRALNPTFVNHRRTKAYEFYCDFIDGKISLKDREYLLYSHISTKNGDSASYLYVLKKNSPKRYKRIMRLGKDDFYKGKAILDNKVQSIQTYLYEFILDYFNDDYTKFYRFIKKHQNRRLFHNGSTKVQIDRMLFTEPSRVNEPALLKLRRFYRICRLYDNGVIKD